MIFNAYECEKTIGYEFKDKYLLKRCCTHSSYKTEDESENNDRLEFFGDSIIEFVVTEYLYNTLGKDSGKLTDERKEIVSKTPLLASAKSLGLDKFLLLGRGLKKTVKKDEKLFSDVYEAIVAGIYIDGGMQPAKDFIYRTIIKDYEKNNDKEKARLNKGGQSKSLFQEYVQKNKLGEIVYKLIERTGSEHLPLFTVALLLDGREVAIGTGTNKKLAEASAAEIALNKLKQAGKQN